VCEEEKLYRRHKAFLVGVRTSLVSTGDRSLMLTIFTAPKPFRDEFDLLQRNAIGSWTHLLPLPQIIVFGDEPGISEASLDLEVEHVPQVDRTHLGTPLVSHLFAGAQRRSNNEIFCYLNADIILHGDFVPAIEAARAFRDDFLMVGRRCTVEVFQPIEFSSPHWETELRDLTETEGRPDPDHFIDYFVFTKGLFGELPAFAIGRAAYDNWLVWRALQRRVPVIDASEAILAVHQMHGYGHVQGGRDEVYAGEEAARNLELAGGRRNLRTIGDATHAMNRAHEIVLARGGKYALARRDRRLASLRSNPWFRSTQSLRHAVGLRRSNWEALARGWRRLRG
jgi:hypothetical protein